MGTIDLTEEDERILAALREGRTQVRTLTDDLGLAHSTLSERLPSMEAAGLVTTVNDETYELTENGRRILDTPTNGSVDDQIDIPTEVEHVIEGFNLRADQKTAIRKTFVFLKYWGEATEPEIKDAVYPEYPARYDSADRWWHDLQGYLTDLPTLLPPKQGQPWRYNGQSDADACTDDGRQILTTGTYGSVKHALEDLDCSQSERAAIRAVFALLYDRDGLTEREIKKAVYHDHPAGYDSAATWWQQCVQNALIELPNTEQSEGKAEGVRWRYVQD